MWLLFLVLIILLIIVGFIYHREIRQYAVKLSVLGGSELPKFREFIDPVFKTQERYNVKPDIYQNINSDNQIRTVVKYGNVAEYARLINLLGKHINVKNSYEKYKILNDLLKMPDKQVYAKICTYMNRDEEERGAYQAKSLFRPLHAFNPDRKYKRYLDVGCGNGLITAEFAKLIDAESTDCVEVSQFDNKDIKYHVLKPNESKLPYADGSMDLITCVMSLHHMTDLPAMLDEIVRVLAPDGVLLIKEHDQWNSVDAMLIDIEHAIFMYCLDNNKDFKDYYIDCRTMNEWRDVMTSKKLKYELGDYFYTSPRQEISATRAAWQIYSKR